MKNKTTGPVRYYETRPAFRVYHPNGGGDGTAAAFRSFPATTSKAGYLQLDIAKQATAGEPEFGLAPTYDWKGRISVRLSPSEVAEMAGVFAGREDSIRGGAGFVHTSETGKSTVALDRVDGPEAGFMLRVGRDAGDGEPAREESILLTQEVALVLEYALPHALGLICFGS